MAHWARRALRLADFPWSRYPARSKEQANALVTSVRELRRKAREVSRAQRGQEKEFKSAAAVIDRLKKVANF